MAPESSLSIGLYVPPLLPQTEPTQTPEYLGGKEKEHVKATLCYLSIGEIEVSAHFTNEDFGIPPPFNIGFFRLFFFFGFSASLATLKPHTRPNHHTDYFLKMQTHINKTQLWSMCYLEFFNDPYPLNSFLDIQ